MTKNLILTCLLGLLFNCAQAQIEDEPEPLPEVDFNHTKYLRDGIMLDADADISLGLLAIGFGYIEPHYEHKFSKKFSVEGYLGLQVFQNWLFYYAMDEENDGIYKFKPGYRIGVNPRLYNGYGITQLGYWGLEFQRSVYNMAEAKTKTTLININKGSKTIVAKSFSLHVSSYFGVGVLDFTHDSQDRKNDDLRTPMYFFGFRAAFGKYIKY